MEYFEELYNVPPFAERLAPAVAPVTPIREDPASCLDITGVVSELKWG